MKIIQYSNYKRKGIAIGWMIVTIMLLVGIMALMIEGARIYYTSHQLQNTADAAALAGSRYVAVYSDPAYSGNAETNARDVAAYYALQNRVLGNRQIQLNLNEGNDPAGEIVIGKYISHLANDNDPTTVPFVPTLDYPNAMKVLDNMGNNSANAPLPMMLGKIFGGQSRHLSRYAIAKIHNPYGAGLLALGKCDCPGVTFSGAGSVDDLVVFGGGSVYSNSINNESIAVAGNVTTDIESIYAVGGIDPKFYNPNNDISVMDINADLGEDNFEPDPYESLPDAVYGTTPDFGTISESGTYSEGYYSGGIQVNDSGTTITLQPGDYYLDSVGQAASLSTTGGLITGEGVTLHIIGDADKGVDVGGNANIDISAPTSGPYADIAIFQKRNPDYDCDLSCSKFPLSELLGTGNINIEGAIYMPHNKLTLGGTGDIILNRTVADRFIIQGTSQKVIDYKGKPRIADKSYLVE